MSKKIDELLAVLNMPEKKQIAFLENYPDKTIDGRKICRRGEWVLGKKSLADLAFRLRDEVTRDLGKDWLNWTLIKRITGENEKKTGKKGKLFWTWKDGWNSYAQPIHWIVIAVIAKAKEKNDKSA